MVVDTSIFIDFLRKKDKTKSELYLIPDSTQLYISSITLYELLMGATTDEKLNDINLLIQNIPVLSFDQQIASKAGEIFHKLKKENKLIEFRDIFIASTCLVYELALKTLNINHFIRIKGLELI